MILNQLLKLCFILRVVWALLLYKIPVLIELSVLLLELLVAAAAVLHLGLDRDHAGGCPTGLGEGLDLNLVGVWIRVRALSELGLDLSL